MKKICKGCGEFKEHHAKGFCQSCYKKQFKNKIEFCKECKKLKEIYAKRLCRKCYMRKWNAENPEKARIRSRKWNAENPEKANVRVKKWHLKNPKRVKVYRKKWYKENPEKANAASRNWQKENPERVKAVKKKWNLENPGKVREWDLKRRGYGTVKKGVANKVITENILKYGIITCEKDKKPCPDNYHIDHILPVSQGGSNDYSNLQILYAHCNLTKHIKIMDYRQIGKNNQMTLKIQGGG